MTVQIDPASLATLNNIQSIWAGALASLKTLIASAQGTTSPPGTTITAPTASTLTDATGATWSLGQTNPTQFGYPVLKNGVQWGGGQAASAQIDINGVVWVKNTPGIWYMTTAAPTYYIQETTGPKIS